MTKLVVLKEKNTGRDIFVNPDHIETVQQRQEQAHTMPYCVLKTSAGNSIEVIATAFQVKQLFESGETQP